jgi:hypothetical protein
MSGIQPSVVAGSVTQGVALGWDMAAPWRSARARLKGSSSVLGVESVAGPSTA